MGGLNENGVTSIRLDGELEVGSTPKLTQAISARRRGPSVDQLEY